MRAGLKIARAHFESFVAGRTEDFYTQLSPTFRYNDLPPIMGEGPVQARRWRELLYSIYRNWRFEITDEHEADGEVIMRINWHGWDPVEPEVTAADFYDCAIFNFRVGGGLLTGCTACYLDFDERADTAEDADAMMRRAFE